MTIIHVVQSIAYDRILIHLIIFTLNKYVEKEPDLKKLKENSIGNGLRALSLLSSKRENLPARE